MLGTLLQLIARWPARLLESRRRADPPSPDAEIPDDGCYRLGDGTPVPLGDLGVRRAYRCES